MRVNLGCGPQVVKDWTNVDYALGAWICKFPLFRYFNNKVKLFNTVWDDDIQLHDLTQKFPWDDNTVEVVYSSHTLEHFSKEDGLIFLKECHRVLRKGGIIRIVVPDLKSVIEQYENGQIRADDFVQTLGVLYTKKNNYIKNKLAPYIQFPHRCMYDTPALLSIMNEIGFEVESRKGLDSDIYDIKEIELEDRTTDAVIVEGKKQ